MPDARHAMRPSALLTVKHWCLVLLAMTCVSACGQIQMMGGKGQVLNTTGQQPVAGATVTLECKRTLIGSGGSAKVRDVATVSDRDGMYGFSFLDVIGCDFGYVRVAKKGYQDSADIHTGYAYTTYGQIPKYRYLTADDDVVMLRLTAITPPRTGTVFHMDGSPAYAAEYTQWYLAFFQAKGIAKTDREKKFVRERYCPALSQLYASMNDQEKADMARYPISYHWRGVTRQGKHDYDAEVVPYCAG